jgi:hypothetical protein
MRSVVGVRISVKEGVFSNTVTSTRSYILGIFQVLKAQILHREQQSPVSRAGLYKSLRPGRRGYKIFVGWQLIFVDLHYGPCLMSSA